MTTKDTGGPAFPMQDPQAIHAYAQARVEFLSSVKRESPMNTAERDAEYIQARAEAIGGLTLRDYFAVHASRQDVEAQAEVLRAQLHKEIGIAILPDGWPATARYMHADAMLEARKA